MSMPEAVIASFVSQDRISLFPPWRRQDIPRDSSTWTWHERHGHQPPCGPTKTIPQFLSLAIDGSQCFFCKCNEWVALNTTLMDSHRRSFLFVEEGDPTRGRQPRELDVGRSTEGGGFERFRPHPDRGSNGRKRTRQHGNVTIHGAGPDVGGGPTWGGPPALSARGRIVRVVPDLSVYLDGQGQESYSFRAGRWSTLLSPCPDSALAWASFGRCPGSGPGASYHFPGPILSHRWLTNPALIKLQ